MSLKIKKEDALRYHTINQPGKIEVVPTKLLSTQLDLALAYSPGVAEPCKEIAQNKDDVYKYTAKGNLVAVISNGTAVLGLGNIGPEASKPVMEGKGVLFKKFAGIDVFDLEIDCNDPEQFVNIVKSMEPTFGGVNLEDIKAPECFYIEQQLREKMNIPIMHDDQHGTAIISGAALINALQLANKKIEEVKFVISGAGAAAISCTKMYVLLGAKKENITMFDKDGALTTSRTNLDPIQMDFARENASISMAEAMKEADVFVGLSAGNIVSQEMVKSMAKDPIVFALANPLPEIAYEDAIAAREDIIMATGRSDHPNQVNNVLGFPYIFRGALDCRATEINETMKLAAVKALAELTHEPVPDIVNKAYGDDTINFGKDYLIPKPLDPRLITTLSPAIAKAAISSGVAKNVITDWEGYEQELLKRIGLDNKMMSRIITRAKQAPKRVVFSEAENYKILKAAQILIVEGIAIPVLLGNVEKVKEMIAHYELHDLDNVEILDPIYEREKRAEYGDLLYLMRHRKGLEAHQGRKLMRERNYFGAMMVHNGDADALISGISRDYAETIRPALQVIGVADGVKKVAGMYVLNSKKGTYFFADTTVNEDPTEEDLMDIIGLTAKAVQFFDKEPNIALVSFSNFGSSKGKVPQKMQNAYKLAKLRYPNLHIEGEMQANIALNAKLMKENYPFSSLNETGANTLIFPDLASGNASYKVLQELGQVEAIGPVLLGMKKPVHILQMGSSVREIINMVAIAVVEAQQSQK